MKCLSILTVVLALLALASATHPDEILKVRPWGLSSSNKWALYPSLETSLDLYADSFVKISYTIAGGFAKPSHFLTKVMIDGQEDKRFR